MRPIDRVLARLPDACKHGKSWRMRCPVHHGESQTSLAISEGDDGRVLLKCHSGCATDDIANTLGLSMADLFDGAGKGKRGSSPSRKPFAHSNTPRQSSKKSIVSNQSKRSKPLKGSNRTDSNTSPRGLTLAQYAEVKKLPLAFLQSLGLSDCTYLGAPALRIPYLAEDGTQAAVRFRLSLAGHDRFRWKTGTKPCLYGLWRLQKPMLRGPLTLVPHEPSSGVIVEGESDCHTLWHQGIPAIGVPGASSWREDRDAPHLDGVDRIYVVIEPDKGGDAFRQWLSRSRIRERVYLLTLGEHKDPSGLYLADPEHFSDHWQAALDAAIPWATQANAERQQEATSTYELAKPLLEAPDLLRRIGQAMQQRGYAGRLDPPTLAYVAMTSRLLERPQNLAFIAPSAAGKNRAVDAALELMPEEAYYLEKAGSARALIYNDEDFQHRVVVAAEADSIPEDGPAASAIRSIAADNAMAYDVVEKNAKTGRFETRRIVKAGPTGLITTSTKSLGTQLGTRVLEIPIPDDPQQTRDVLKAHARSVSCSNHGEVDLAPYLALQRWLAAQGEQQVMIPFAEVLAELVPAHAVRMRRDFRQLLTCIQAIALLHQCRRQKSPEGAILATLEDYQHARELLLPIFDSIVAEGVTPVIRQTVEAITGDEHISEAMLAQRLRLAKSTVHYRVSRALAGGWLVNHEMRKGYPASLSRGAPLPDVTHVLPRADDIVAKLGEGEDRSNRSIRTPAPNESFEQEISVCTTSKNTEVFECSNESGDRREAPSPPPVQGVTEHPTRQATPGTICPACGKPRLWRPPGAKHRLHCLACNAVVEVDHR